MEIKYSGAKQSQIIKIGEKIKSLSKEDNCQYLPLNRGVNQVVNIDISETVKSLDFNSPEMQIYPPSCGIYKLREAINNEYFMGNSYPENILITGGGMMAIDLAIQSLKIEKLLLPTYYWGCYYHILTIRSTGVGEYSSQSELIEMIPKLKGSAVLICDPGNPLGEKHDDTTLFNTIRTLSDNNITVIFDSPYRRMFLNSTDDLYSRILTLENVIITESFSKSLGLSGQRLGFVHTTNKELLEEMHLRLNYSTNGINTFAQLLVYELLTSDTGRHAVAQFKSKTVSDIMLNIEYLAQKGLLATQFYQNSKPQGLFVVVKLSEEELLKKHIGSVSLSFFTKSEKEYAANFARICVSIPHVKLVKFL